MPSTYTYFVSGASRSLGLAREQGRVLVVAFDVDSEESVRSAAEKLKADSFLEGGALDAVVVNAGVFVGGHKPPSEMTMDDVRANFRTNVEGAIYTVHQMAGGVSYSMSKAGASTCTASNWPVELGPNKFDNGGEISVEEAVTEATNNVFLPAKPEWNGRYIAYTGKDLPW
ncbi:short-chain dehydrogenase/reductase SDR family protein [Rhodotorula toruloides]|uniref:Short-chain dehydrogenase/reductase SDR family protein n=1 Tax=Rhodotorula toruloides TaxID=5286 RepID=A0A511KR78_RHOTO|nr:short-chain dehydrogenase/reductase SDR family protein [Rhodotorula toruloides]